MKKLFYKIKWKKVIRLLVIITILGTGAYLGFRHVYADKATPSAVRSVQTTRRVETRTIRNVLSSSGSIEPLNTYEVMSLVEGEVIAADFEEGETVEKGQVLYQIATDTLDSQIAAAQTKVERAEKDLSKVNENYKAALADYVEAKADYEKAKAKYGDPNVKSTVSGVVKTLFAKQGENLQKGAQIAEIYDNSYMLLTIPFNASDAEASLVGKTSSVTIEGNFETIKGTVTGVSLLDRVLSGNRLVRDVTIKVKNPGGITDTARATATIGDLCSTEAGSFSVLTDTMIISEVSGEIASVPIQVGGRISEGDVILTLSQETIDDQLSNYANAVENAKKSVDSALDSTENVKDTLEDAKASLQDIVDSKADYSITAPISGKVISKNTLVGDTVKNGGNSSALCVIYDLSAVIFSMNVDELDVKQVKEGQEVSITADALEGVKITGVITNISLVSSSNSGVTQYPVTVRIDEAGDLLPGMNVTGDIIVEQAENCIAIPSDALMRNNFVYIKDDTITEADGDVPAGFKKVQVETGITDGDYVQVLSGLTGSEEVYIKRNISSEAATGEESWLDGLGFGGNEGARMPSGARGNFSGGGNFGGGNFGGGNFRSGGSRSNNWSQ